MPDDRSRSARGTSRGGTGRGNGGSRSSSGTPSGKPKRSGKPDGRGGSGKPSGPPKRSGKPTSSGAPKRSGKPTSSGAPKRSGRPDGRGGRGRDDRHREDRSEPRTEAERRAAEVRARRGPRRTPRTEAAEQAKIESRTTDEWIDEGSVRDAAEAATRRAGGGRSSSRHDAELDPSIAAEIHDALPSDRAKRLTERLASASAALDRERFEEARRMVTPLAKELPQVAAVHEVGGLASYRLGRWSDAAKSLELARQLRPDPSLLPVLADCYRAMGRWSDVDEVWSEVKAASPPHDVMAEGRIVAASALADRGDLKAAITLMSSVAQPPKRIRDHHLRQWYVLADFYDRAGDTLAASRWFREVAASDPEFADVKARLRALGR